MYCSKCKIDISDRVFPFHGGFCPGENPKDPIDLLGATDPTKTDLDVLLEQKAEQTLEQIEAAAADKPGKASKAKNQTSKAK